MRRPPTHQPTPQIRSRTPSFGKSISTYAIIERFGIELETATPTPTSHKPRGDLCQRVVQPNSKLPKIKEEEADEEHEEHEEDEVPLKLLTIEQ